jgi:general secretion pathway protein J
MRLQRNGFTLLELTVALAVFGLLLVLLTQGVQFGLLAWRSQARLAAANGDLNEIDLTLRHLIGAMDPGRGDEDYPTLLAKRDTMTFVTDLPGAEGTNRAPHVAAKLFVDPRHRLVLLWQPRPAVGGPNQPPAWQETELLRGIAGIELAIWRPNGGWSETWQAGDLPAMVRIRLAFANSAAQHWPDIVIAPRLDRP